MSISDISLQVRVIEFITMAFSVNTDEPKL